VHPAAALAQRGLTSQTVGLPWSRGQSWYGLLVRSALMRRPPSENLSEALSSSGCHSSAARDSLQGGAAASTYPDAAGAAASSSEVSSQRGPSASRETASSLTTVSGS